MGEEFLEYLRSTKESYQKMFLKKNDSYLNQYKFNFLLFEINTDFESVGGSINDNFIDIENSEEISSLKDAYSQLSKDIDDFKKQALNLLTRKIRNRINFILSRFFIEIFDIENSSYYSFIMYEYQSMPHLFEHPNIKINNIDDSINKNIIIEIMIDAKVSVKFIDSILDLLRNLIQNNLKAKGNLLLYFFFAPWEKKFTPILELLIQYFDKINIYYPLCMMTYSNRVIYVCKNKKKNKNSIKNNETNLDEYNNRIKSKIILKNNFEKMINYSKKITYYALYTFQLMRYIMIREIENSPLSDVMINKIITHFNNQPLINKCK